MLFFRRSFLVMYRYVLNALWIFSCKTLNVCYRMARDVIYKLIAHADFLMIIKEKDINETYSLILAGEDKSIQKRR